MLSGFRERNQIEECVRSTQLIVENISHCQFRRRVPDHPRGAKFLCHSESRLELLDGTVCLEHQQVGVPECIIRSRDPLRILDLHCDPKHCIGMCERIPKKSTLCQTECNIPLGKRLERSPANLPGELQRFERHLLTLHRGLRRYKVCF